MRHDALNALNGSNCGACGLTSPRIAMGNEASIMNNYDSITQNDQGKTLF